MSAYRYEQRMEGDTSVSEVWGVTNVPDDRKDEVVKEWIDRHNAHANASGYTRMEVSPLGGGGHLIHKAWRA